MQFFIKKILGYVTMITCLTFSSLSLAATSPVLDAELEKFKSDFGSKTDDLNVLFKRLSWTGITDPSLYDIMKERIQKNYMNKTENGIEANAFLIRSMALSGDMKYYDFFIYILKSDAPKKLRRHAKMAAHRIKGFTVSNPVIARNNEKATTQDELNRMRVLNMISSDVGELAAAGANHVHEEYPNDLKMVSAVNDRLLSSYSGKHEDDDLRALTLMCVVVGNSGFTQYKSTLDKISNAANVQTKLKSAAKRNAKLL